MLALYGSRGLSAVITDYGGCAVTDLAEALYQTTDINEYLDLIQTVITEVETDIALGFYRAFPDFIRDTERVKGSVEVIRGFLSRGVRFRVE